MSDKAALLSDGVPTSGMTLKLAWVTFLALPGAMQFGWASGVMNEPESSIQATINISSNSFALTVAIFAVGGAFGTQFGGKLADRFGRRLFLWLHSIIFVIAGAMEGLCPDLPAPLFWLAFARLLIGFGSGGASVVVPMYIGEVAPQRLRGAMTALNQFALTIAILVSQVLGIYMSNNPAWRYLLAGTAFIGSASLLTGWMLPETPKWLVQQGRTEEAAKVLVSLRGYALEDAQREIAVIAETASASTESVGVGELLRSADLRPQLLILLTVHATQQLSGINAVFYYSTTFFSASGIKNAAFATTLIGAVNVLATGAGVVLTERSGRRPLIVWGSFTMLIAALCLTVMLCISHYDPSAPSFVGVLAVIFIMIFVSGFEVGLGPIPWAIGTEIFSENVRGTAMAVGGSLNWFCNFLIGIGFPAMHRGLGPYSFIPFVVVLTLCFIYTSKNLPETKNRTLVEIEALFHKRKVPQKLTAVA